MRYDALDLDVVTPVLHVFQEPGERGPVDNMCSPLRALAVTDGGDAGQVCRDLNAAPVVRTQGGLPPDGLRQVGHCDRYSIPLAKSSRYTVVSSGSSAASMARSNDWM